MIREVNFGLGDLGSSPWTSICGELLQAGPLSKALNPVTSPQLLLSLNFIIKIWIFFFIDIFRLTKYDLELCPFWLTIFP